MRLNDLLRLYAYGQWATNRLLTAANALTVESVRRPLAGSFGSLHGTLDHLHGVERLWLDRWMGRAPGLPTSLGPDAGVAEFRVAWKEVWTGQRAYLASLTEEALDAPFTYRNQSGNSAHVIAGDMLMHVVNHGTYHRGQIASQIRQLGGTPAATDFLLFAREAGAR